MTSQVTDGFLEECLKRRFAVEGFRDGQREAVKGLLEGRDVFVNLATGYGKSLIYQLPPIIFSEISPGTKDISFVISPLISLMEDQVSQLLKRKISAVYIAHTIGITNEQNALKGIANGDYRIVYITPERVSTSNFSQILSNLYSSDRISLFAIDEAHCLSEWGAEFRPDYSRLSRLKESFPNTPIVALTATATATVQQDIFRQLHLNNDNLLKIIRSYNRPNLFYCVKEKSSFGMEFDLAFLTEPPLESAIVYMPSIQGTEDVCTMLTSKGIKCAVYNSTLTATQRTETHKQFISGNILIVVATVAFGMGIDKPNVRKVIHYGPPRSLEAYFQQSGRAGRDSLPAFCTLFWEPKDFGKAGFVTNMASTEEERARSRVLIGHVKDFVNDTVTCRRSILLEYFGETINSKTSSYPFKPECCCDNCKLRGEKPIEMHNFANEVRLLLGSIKKVGKHLGVSKAIKLLRESGGSVGKRFSIRSWEEIAVQVKRVGLLEERTNGMFAFTTVSTSGEKLLTSDNLATVNLPISIRVKNELNGIRAMPTSSGIINRSDFALHIIPRKQPPTNEDKNENDNITDEEEPTKTTINLRCGRALPSWMSASSSSTTTTTTARRRNGNVQQLSVFTTTITVPKLIQPVKQQVIVIEQNLIPPPNKRQCYTAAWNFTTELKPQDLITVFENARNSSNSSRRSSESSKPWFMRFSQQPQ